MAQASRAYHWPCARNALSGSYRSWETVALHLVADGFGDAREILDDPLLRQELDGYCNPANDRS